MPNSRALGIDPGVGRCGWAVVQVTGGKETLEGSGCFTTNPKDSPAERLLSLDQQLDVVIKKYTPERLGIEKLYFTNNVTTAMAVSQARGVILLAAARYHLAVTELSPTTVKQSITGYGRSDKKAIAMMIERLLKLEPRRRTDDEYDAIGIALTLAHQRT